jgi:hypothetical protein
MVCRLLHQMQALRRFQTLLLHSLSVVGTLRFEWKACQILRKKVVISIFVLCLCVDMIRTGYMYSWFEIAHAGVKYIHVREPAVSHCCPTSNLDVFFSIAVRMVIRCALQAQRGG